MNKARREKIKEAISYLDRAHAIIDTAYDQESDALENCPENLQSSERCERMEEATESMYEAMDHIDEAKSALEGILS